MMKKIFLIGLIIAEFIVFTGCESLESYSGVAPNSSNEEYSESIETIIPIKTMHFGTIMDPIPIGEYEEWSFSLLNKESLRRQTYEVRMNVNYSIRGDAALKLYNDFNYDPEDYFYKDYRPTNGYELAIINITIHLDSAERTPAELNPLSFMLSTASGLGVSTNDPQVNYPRYLRYYNLFAGEVYPEAKITANLVYEVPVNQKILIGLADVWFRIDSEDGK